MRPQVALLAAGASALVVLALALLRRRQPSRPSSATRKGGSASTGPSAAVVGGAPAPSATAEAAAVPSGSATPAEATSGETTDAPPPLSSTSPTGSFVLVDAADEALSAASAPDGPVMSGVRSSTSESAAAEVDEDSLSARELYDRAVDYLCGRCGCTVDLPRAIGLLRRSSDAGCARAQAVAGLLEYQTLTRAQHHTERGRVLLSNAAAQDDALALLYIGCMARTMNVRIVVPGLPEINYAEALARLRAEQPADPVSLYVQGLCKYHGVGEPEDHSSGAALYEHAASVGQGLGLALRHLGVCYARGDGLVQNFAQAAACFERAGQQGYADALSFLGNCYRNGDGVPADPRRAFELYRVAAEAGFAVAQHNVGKCLLNGEGVARDVAAGVRWLRAAAAQGDVRARSALAALDEETLAGRGTAPALASSQ